jgi:hypothetical protein
VSRWGPDGPPQEAYSRVTDPERFAPLVDAADALVADLVATYDVVAEPVTVEGALRAVRLTPRTGAPLTVGVTEFPSVAIARGHWGSGAIPQCGCDACDEDAASAIEALRELVTETVAGEFSETLTEHPPRLATSGRNHRGWTALDRELLASLAAIAPPGTYEWGPWPRRGPAGPDSLSP